MKHGILVISLDFELFWGVRDHRTKEEYGENILGVREVIPQMVSLFEKYGIHVTYAIVGLLLCKSKAEIKTYLPKLKPGYNNKHLSPYEDNYIDSLLDSDDPYHSAAELISQLRKSSNVEIGSHTFCHYYCKAKGQNLNEFEADINAAIKISTDNGLEIKSFVFPRNQCSQDYLKVCAKHGITHYRGNSHHTFGLRDRFINKSFRFLDSYFNILGDSCYNIDEIQEELLTNIKASRFLYPYSSKLKLFEGLRLKRIKNEMTRAAKENKVYHLWWHPHNFGKNQELNLRKLESILKHYEMLSKEYGFKSNTMSEINA